MFPHHPRSRRRWAHDHCFADEEYYVGDETKDNEIIGGLPSVSLKATPTMVLIPKGHQSSTGFYPNY